MVEVTGIVGDPFCGYFGIVIFDKNNNETTRRIQWLNDFSGINRIINIVFQAPDNATHVVAIYRINNDTPRKSYCRYTVQPLDTISILEVDSSIKENYDMPENYTMSRSRELAIQEGISRRKFSVDICFTKKWYNVVNIRTIIA